MDTSILTQSKEQVTPQNDHERPKQFKTITVNVSQCLSTTVDIEVPIDFEDYDNTGALCDFVREQIVLPSDCLEYNGYWWGVDEFWAGI